MPVKRKRTPSASDAEKKAKATVSDTAATPAPATEQKHRPPQPIMTRKYAVLLIATYPEDPATTGLRCCSFSNTFIQSNDALIRAAEKCADDTNPGATCVASIVLDSGWIDEKEDPPGRETVFEIVVLRSKLKQDATTVSLVTERRVVNMRGKYTWSHTTIEFWQDVFRQLKALGGLCIIQAVNRL